MGGGSGQEHTSRDRLLGAAAGLSDISLDEIHDERLFTAHHALIHPLFAPLVNEMPSAPPIFAQIAVAPEDKVK